MMYMFIPSAIAPQRRLRTCLILTARAGERRQGVAMSAAVSAAGQAVVPLNCQALDRTINFVPQQHPPELVDRPAKPRICLLHLHAAVQGMSVGSLCAVCVSAPVQCNGHLIFASKAKFDCTWRCDYPEVFWHLRQACKSIKSSYMQQAFVGLPQLLKALIATGSCSSGCATQPHS